MLIRNPFAWLCRVRHRRGYGIHSPFAFALVTQVLYSPGEYYAYSWLARLHPWYVRWFHLRPLAHHRLFFRLANFWQPLLVAAPGLTPVEWNYLHEGCRRAVIDPGLTRKVADMMLLRCDEPGWGACVGERTLLVVERLTKNRALWQSVVTHPEVRVTFDLHDVGIAFFDPKLQRQNYVINW